MSLPGATIDPRFAPFEYWRSWMHVTVWIVWFD